MSLALSDPDLVRAPDLIEPVEAWRVWRVGMHAGRVVLESLFTGAGTVWEPAVPLAAVCAVGHRSRLRPWRVERNAHAAPDLDCGCGIYGLRSVAAARSYLEGPAFACRDERVIGRVALWGTVVEGPSGWRASHAYPMELYVPASTVAQSGLRRRAHVEETYRVPVDLVAPKALAAR
jgi:hypothetical protein